MEVRKIVRDIKDVSVQTLIFTNKEVEDRLELEDDFILEILNKGKIFMNENSKLKNKNCLRRVIMI